MGCDESIIPTEMSIELLESPHIQPIATTGTLPVMQLRPKNFVGASFAQTKTASRRLYFVRRASTVCFSKPGQAACEASSEV